MDDDVIPNPSGQSDMDFELAAFDISLAPSGDEGSGFHTQHDPRDLRQRDRVIDRLGAVRIQGSCVDIIHGLFAPDGEAFATLLVLEFRFDPRKRARRLAQVDIELRFSGKDPSAADPDVYAISPDGRFSFLQTSQTESVTTETGLHVGGGLPGAGGGGTIKYRRNVVREMNSATTVTSSIDLRGRNYGNPNSVSWTLMENPETKTGVPISMRTAILLKRRDEEEFQCVVSLKAKADWRTSMEWLAGTTKSGSPWRIDPTRNPTSDKYTEMELKLGELDLEAISDVTVMNIVDGVVKTKNMGNAEE